MITFRKFKFLLNCYLNYCLFHLIVTYFKRQEDKHNQEMDAIIKLSKMLPKNAGGKLTKLFVEYEDRLSPESILTKQLDVFDAVLQAVSFNTKCHLINILICFLSFA